MVDSQVIAALPPQKRDVGPHSPDLWLTRETEVEDSALFDALCATELGPDTTEVLTPPRRAPGDDPPGNCQRGWLSVQGDVISSGGQQKRLTVEENGGKQDCRAVVLREFGVRRRT